MTLLIRDAVRCRTYFYPPFGLTVFFQLSDQVLHGGEIDAHASHAGLQMGPADARGPQEDHIVSVG